jgi:hypothetical protein
MDFLIDRLHAFAITKNEQTFNDSIDQLLIHLKLNETDSDQEWETLKKNYSDIKYIYQLLNHYNYHFHTNHFYEIVSKFCLKIDTTTQYYIKNIDFEETDLELKECCKMIRSHLESSLNENDYLKKIKHILDAYNILVPIVEDFRREKYYD